MLTMYYQSPIGPLRLVGDGTGLTHLLFLDQPAPEGAAEGESPLLRQAAQELEEYFQGARREFSVPLHPYGTRFQQKVWATLRSIPYGQTVSYKDIAVQIGYQPSASRAVGQANGKNPLPVFIPCHRVIAAGGALGGYSLGLELKRRLLALEAEHKI